MIRVLIADDQAIIRDGLEVILDTTDDLEVVAAVEDGQTAVDAVARTRPDVVVMDIQMPNMDGIEATRQIASRPDPPRVLVLTTFGEDKLVFAALQAGASGFLLKDSGRDVLIRAVRAVAAGTELVDSAITRRLVEHSVRAAAEPEREAPVLDDFTEREVQVLGTVVRGLSNAQIARELYVSEATVKSHVASILRKLGVPDRIQIVIWAYESGFVRPE